jgi:hypothetical protein
MRDATQVKTHPLVLTGTKACGATVPPLTSTLVTASIMIVGLIISEQISRYIIFSLKVRAMRGFRTFACAHSLDRSLTNSSLAPPDVN